MDNFSWGHNKRYNDFPTYIKKSFGGRVQKISVNVGFTCPNRDGTKGTGGCIYCNNSTFKPGYCEPENSISKQIEKGVEFFEKKYPDMEYMAYFQSYTNTYAEVSELRKMYEEALNHKKVVGLVIGTRPDCINEEIVDMLVDVSRGKYLTVELGLESTLDVTLDRINRCHSWADSVRAIELCASKDVNVGGHLILGLPGESDADILSHAKIISKLPIHTLKLHQLQVTKGTRLAVEYEKNPESIRLFSYEEYMQLIVRFLEELNPDIIVERFVSVSPIEKLIAPHWNRIKNFEIVAQIEKNLKELNTWQGKNYSTIE